jgi:hypothetical protein
MRVLRHARRLGGGSSALEPTEAGIAVTNQVRRAGLARTGWIIKLPPSLSCVR